MFFTPACCCCCCLALLKLAPTWKKLYLNTCNTKQILNSLRLLDSPAKKLASLTASVNYFVAGHDGKNKNKQKVRTKTLATLLTSKVSLFTNPGKKILTYALKTFLPFIFTPWKINQAQISNNYLKKKKSRFFKT